MPTALTVAAAVKTKVPPLSRRFAVPDPGTGVEPSVVYQIPVFPKGNDPEVNPGSVKVTVRGNVCASRSRGNTWRCTGEAAVGPVSLPLIGLESHPFHRGSVADSLKSRSRIFPGRCRYSCLQHGHSPMPSGDFAGRIGLHQLMVIDCVITHGFHAIAIVPQRIHNNDIV